MPRLAVGFQRRRISFYRRGTGLLLPDRGLPLIAPLYFPDRGREGDTDS